MNFFRNMLFVLFLCLCVGSSRAVHNDFDSFEMVVQDLNFEDLDAFEMVVVDFDPDVHDVAEIFDTEVWRI